jgi:hypothetical protein
MATPVDRDPTPCPLAVLTAAMTKHNVDGKRMLALAAKGADGAEELAELCTEFATFSPKRRILFLVLCAKLLAQFQRDAEAARERQAEPETLAAPAEPGRKKRQAEDEAPAEPGSKKQRQAPVAS